MSVIVPISGCAIWRIHSKVSNGPGLVIKAIIRNAARRVIATARKEETEGGFPDYIEKAERGAVGRSLALCGYGTLQAPEVEEGERLVDTPVKRPKGKNWSLASGFVL